MKLSFIAKEMPGCIGPVVVPVCAESGEMIEGVVNSKAESMIGDRTELTITVLLHNAPKSNNQ